MNNPMNRPIQNIFAPPLQFGGNLLVSQEVRLIILVHIASVKLTASKNKAFPLKWAAIRGKAVVVIGCAIAQTCQFFSDRLRIGI
jgi:hypothetical protein